MKQVVVVGAGPAGLTIGVKLAEAGIRTVLIERAPFIGGNCRSFRYGAYTFDVGIHCFGRCDRDVKAFIDRLCGGELVPLGALKPAAYFMGQYRRELGALRVRHLPLDLLVRGMWDFLTRAPAADTRSLGQVAASYYGRTFSEILVKRRIEALTRMSCDGAHVDFGRYFWLSPPSDDISLGGALLKASRRLLGSSRSTNGVDPFSTFYPTSGGFGEFCDRLSNAFLAAGGETRTQSGIESLGLDDGRIRTVAVGGEQLPVDWVIWTGDLPSLGRLLNLPVLPSIDHLYLALFHFEVAGPRAHDYLWVDFTEPDMLVHRASYNNINRPRNAPPGCHGITAEVACRVDDEVWRSPDHFIGAVRDQLIATGFVRSADGILACHVERVPRAWPLLGLDYREHAENLLRRVKERAANLSATYRPGESLPTVDRVLQRAFDVSNDVRQQLGIGEAVSMRT